MKKRLLLITIMATGLLTSQLFAQGLFVKLNTGYSLSSNNSGDYFYNTTYTDNGYSRELVNRSLSTGLNFGGSVGYMFNSNLGFELGLSYLKGLASTTSSEYDGYGEFEQSEISSSMFRIAPSIVLIADMPNLNPYARFGVILGSGKIKEGYSLHYIGKKSLNATNADYDEIVEYEYSGSLAFGFSGSLGVLYGLSEKLSFFGEVNFSNMSYAPEKRKMVKFNLYGEDILSDLTVRDKEIIFVNKLTYEWEGNQPSDQPSKELKRSYPFGNYGVNFGLRIGL